MTLYEKTAELINTVDAAGFGLVILRCNSDYDIRSIVRQAYVNKHSEEAQVFEATTENSFKKFDKAFNWKEHHITEFSENPSIINFLNYSGATPGGYDRQILFIPDIRYLIGTRDNPTELRNLYISLIKDCCRRKKLNGLNWLIIVGSDDEANCSELEECSYIIDVPYPDTDEIKSIIRSICSECYGQENLIQSSRLNMLAEIMRGLRYENIRDILYLAFAKRENPAAGDSRAIFEAANQAKRQFIKNTRGLSWIDPADTQVGGLAGLVEFINKKRTIFVYPNLAKKTCADTVKGLLVCGLPGSGKTTMAKLTAKLLGTDESSPLPLVSLDVSELQSKWYGESQANCKKALRVIESLAPCVVIIDEIEKVFGSMSSNDPHEASQQIFQTVLDWMQKKREKPVFVFATANKVDRLPSELKRKGRFDEVFFSGLPTEADCRLIFNVHISKKATAIDFDGKKEKDVYTALATEFINQAYLLRRFLSGADIESIIDSAFSELLDSALKGKSEQELLEISNKDTPIRFKAADISSALLRQLSYTRTYFDNNMDTTLDFIRNMYERGFKDAAYSIDSDNQALPILPIEKGYFNKAVNMFDLKKMEEKGYLSRCSQDMLNKWNDKKTYRQLLELQLNNASTYDSVFRWTIIKEFFSTEG